MTHTPTPVRGDRGRTTSALVAALAVLITAAAVAATTIGAATARRHAEQEVGPRV